MSRSIYLVTHGEKSGGANPGLTEEGKRHIALIIAKLPRQIHSVVCGVGLRHLDTAKVLQLNPDRYSGTVGAAESKNRKSNTVILADGTEIPYEKYSAVADRTDSFKKLVRSLPARTVVITSRSMIQILEPTVTGKAATLYRFNPDNGELTELFSASNDIGDGIKEV